MMIIFFCGSNFQSHRGDNFVIEYLGEIKTEFVNTLACLSGAQMGLNLEKNGRRKSRDTLPFKGPIELESEKNRGKKSRGSVPLISVK